MRQIVVFGAVSLPSGVRTHEDAQWYAYGANSKHGLLRTTKDKRRAVEAALQHEKRSKFGNRELAAYLGVSHTYIITIESDLSSKRLL